MSLSAPQIAARALRATISVVAIRDPVEGTSRYAVQYESGAALWLSPHRFPAVTQAEAGALVSTDFLGAAEVR